MRTKLARAERRIGRYLNSLPTRVHTRQDLQKMFQQERHGAWDLALHTGFAEFLDFALERGLLQLADFRATQYPQEHRRYYTGAPSPFEFACSLRSSGYFSHGTAAYLHGLTESAPASIHLNIEQSAKPSKPILLTQAAIDRAFAGRQRESKLTFVYRDISINVLSGKNTKRLGVETIRGPASEKLPVTSVERTLIDLAVRPTYAGGIAQVLTIYRNARPHVSAPDMDRILRQINHAYPYAQAIGFLMHRAGYTEAQYEPFGAQLSAYRFHLTHGLKQPSYDEQWRLYYPQGL